jgi:magnesium chelatase family protein
VETQLDQGLPRFFIVGLPDNAVKESMHRVIAAIKNSGFKFPNRRVTINLAPADEKKEGSAYDLPIALGILFSSEQLKSSVIQDFIILGELALDGTLRPVHGSLVIACEAKKYGMRKMIVPEENAAEAAMVEGIEVFPVRTFHAQSVEGQCKRCFRKRSKIRGGFFRCQRAGERQKSFGSCGSRRA